MNPFQLHGAFSWCELMTSDPDAAKEFYQRLFGWTLKDEPMAGGKTYPVIQAGSQKIGGILSTAAALSQETPPPHWGTYVTVANVDQTVKLAESIGAKILVAPLSEHIPLLDISQVPQLFGSRLKVSNRIGLYCQ